MVSLLLSISFAFADDFACEVKSTRRFFDGYRGWAEAEGYLWVDGRSAVVRAGRSLEVPLTLGTGEHYLFFASTGTGRAHQVLLLDDDGQALAQAAGEPDTSHVELRHSQAKHARAWLVTRYGADRKGKTPAEVCVYAAIFRKRSLTDTAPAP